MKNKMLEPKTNTQPSLSPYQAERVEAQQTPGFRPDPLGATLAPPGREATVRAHAAGLNPATAGRTLRRLQRQYGNRYVQRVVAQRQSGGEGFQLDDETAGRINRARGGGQPLDGPVQAHMSEALGHDFSGVRVHTGSEAHTLNRLLSARAFTTGHDIFFRQGEYNPGAGSGRELIAHELTHVVQQGTGRVSGSGSGMTVRAAGDAFEREAETLVYKELKKSGDEVTRQTSFSRKIVPTRVRNAHRRACGGSGRVVQRYWLRIGTQGHEVREKKAFLAQEETSVAKAFRQGKWKEAGDPASPESKAVVKAGYEQGVGKGGWRIGMTEAEPLRNVTKNEELHIIAHGSLARMVGGYTPKALLSMLLDLGLGLGDRRGAFAIREWHGDTWFHGCVTARRDADRRGSSFIEEFSHSLQDRAIGNQVYGLVGLAVEGQEEPYLTDDEKRAWERKKARRDAIEGYLRRPVKRIGADEQRKRRSLNDELRPLEAELAQHQRMIARRAREWYQAKPYGPSKLFGQAQQAKMYEEIDPAAEAARVQRKQAESLELFKQLGV